MELPLFCIFGLFFKIFQREEIIKEWGLIPILILMNSELRNSEQRNSELRNIELQNSELQNNEVLNNELLNSKPRNSELQHAVDYS